MSNGTRSQPSAIFTLSYKLRAAVIPILAFIIMSGGMVVLLVFLTNLVPDETRAAGRCLGLVFYMFAEVAIAFLVLEFYPFLGGDIRFEERLIKKLKASGRLTFEPDSPTVNLIGITHPENVRWWKLDHDDDVGFMRVIETHFEYIGEAEDVKIALNSIERISEQPYPVFSVMGLKWAIIDYKEGDQSKRLFIHARDKVSIRKTVAETRDITVRLMSLCELARKNTASAPGSAPQVTSEPAAAVPTQSPPSETTEPATTENPS